MNSGCRSQTTCQRPDSINLFCLVADRFRWEGGNIDDAPKENSISSMELAFHIAKSLSYYSFPVVAVQRLCVQTRCYRGFLPLQGQNKQTVCSVLTPLNVTPWILTLGTMKTWLICARADQFFWHNYRNITPENSYTQATYVCDVCSSVNSSGY